MSGVEIWQHVNDSLKIALWPAVVAWVFFALRHKIRERISDVESVESPALTVKLARRDLPVGEAVEEILNRTTEAEDDAGERDHREAEAEAGKPTPRATLLDVREDIEEVIRESFRAGLSAAQAPGDDTPDVHPIIEWTGSKPSIKVDAGALPRRKQSMIVDTGPALQWRRELDRLARRGSERSNEDEALGLRNYILACVSQPQLHLTLVTRRYLNQKRQTTPKEELAAINQITSIEAEMARIAMVLTVDSRESATVRSNLKLWQELWKRLETLDEHSPLLVPWEEAVFASRSL